MKWILWKLGIVELPAEDEVRLSDNPERIHPVLRRTPYFLSLRDFLDYVPGPEFFGFCIIRHPLERLQSFYKDKIKTGEWSKGALKKFEKKYGVSPGTSWPKYLEKVLQIPQSEQNQHIRSFTETLAPIRTSWPIRLYTINQLDSWAEDFGSHMETLGRSVQLQQMLPRLNQSSPVRKLSIKGNLSVPRRLAGAFEEAYGQDIDIVELVERHGGSQIFPN